MSSGGDDVALGVEQIALAIAFVDRAKHPAVPVEIRELRVLELLVEFRRPDLFQKFEIRPQPARRRAFRIRLPSDSAPRRVGLCCFFGYMISPSVSLSHQM